MKFRWKLVGRGHTVRTWSGMPIPAGVRVLVMEGLSALIESAQGSGIGWDANGISLSKNDLYALFPYSYEERPFPLWKCRLVAFVDGLSVEPGAGKKILFGRLDVPVSRYERLPITSRNIERQLLHWLAWKAAASSWKKGDVR